MNALLVLVQVESAIMSLAEVVEGETTLTPDSPERGRVGKARGNFWLSQVSSKPISVSPNVQQALVASRFKKYKGKTMESLSKQTSAIPPQEEKMEGPVERELTLVVWQHSKSKS